MKYYKHIIFDFDGVLCDSLDAAIQVFNLVRDSKFPQIPRIAAREDMTAVYSGILKTSLRKFGLDEEDSRAFFDAHSEGMAGRVGDLRAFPGIENLLTRLPPNCCSIVTSAYSDAVRLLLSFGKSELPEAIFRIAGREYKQSKTLKIQTILDELSLSPEDAIYVGDLESDILYCKAVPIDIIGVGYGYHPANYIRSCNPTFLADTPEDLSVLIAKLCNLNTKGTL